MQATPLDKKRVIPSANKYQATPIGKPRSKWPLPSANKRKQATRPPHGKARQTSATSLLCSASPFRDLPMCTAHETVHIHPCPFFTFLPPSFITYYLAQIPSLADALRRRPCGLFSPFRAVLWMLFPNKVLTYPKKTGALLLSHCTHTQKLAKEGRSPSHSSVLYLGPSILGVCWSIVRNTGGKSAKTGHLHFRRIFY